MSHFFKQISSDKIFLLGLGGSLVLLTITLVIIGIFYTKLAPFLPLFNQMTWGVARLGTKEELFIPAFISLVILTINSIVATYIYEKLPLVSRILCITSLLIALFVLLFTIRTIQIII